MTAYERDFALSYKVMLIAIVVLFAAALLVLFLHIYLRWRYLRRISSLRRGRRLLVFAGEIQNGPSPADRGLVPDILKSLPIFVFSNADAGDGEEVVECAVCLNEFEEGEKVRSLPRCGHRFHLECIDMWFYSHANCPLCRAAVDAPLPQVNSTIPERIPMSYPSAAPIFMNFYLHRPNCSVHSSFKKNKKFSKLPLAPPLLSLSRHRRPPSPSFSLAPSPTPPPPLPFQHRCPPSPPSSPRSQSPLLLSPRCSPSPPPLWPRSSSHSPAPAQETGEWGGEETGAGEEEGEGGAGEGGGEETETVGRG